jgi:hypothetical protein
MFEGAALLRRLHRLGVMEESQNKLDECLSLTLENFLKRRLQSRVLDAGMAKSIHHARTLIKGRHIRYVLVASYSILGHALVAGFKEWACVATRVAVRVVLCVFLESSCRMCCMCMYA